MERISGTGTRRSGGFDVRQLGVKPLDNFVDLMFFGGPTRS